MTEKKMFELNFSEVELRVLAHTASHELDRMKLIMGGEDVRSDPPTQMEKARDTWKGLIKKFADKMEQR